MVELGYMIIGASLWIMCLLLFIGTVELACHNYHRCMLGINLACVFLYLCVTGVVIVVVGQHSHIRLFHQG